jgi:hypothetical protein
MIVQSFAPATSDGHRTNRGDFNRFVEVVGTAPVIEGVRVQIGWADEATD